MLIDAWFTLRAHPIGATVTIAGQLYTRKCADCDDWRDAEGQRWGSAPLRERMVLAGEIAP